MNNKVTLANKIALAKTLYGNIRKITNYIYISDSTYDKSATLGVSTGMQTMFNIQTGEILEKRYVMKITPLEEYVDTNNRKKLRTSYNDDITKSRNNLVYVTPQQEVQNNKLRVYTEDGKVIYSKECKNKVYEVRHKDFISNEYNKIILFIDIDEDDYSNGELIIYDTVNNKISKIYTDVIQVRFIDDFIISIHLLTYDTRILQKDILVKDI